MDVTLQKLGGLAALICAATYIFGFVILTGPISETGFGTDDVDQAALLAFLSENFVLMSTWYLTIYVVNGLFLALLVLAIKSRLNPSRPLLAKLIQPLGLIWATLVIGAGMAANVGLTKTLSAYDTDPETAGRLWQMTELIETGIGGGNEILGGLLALLIGGAALTSGVLPKMLALLSLVIGIAGLLTVLAPFEPVAAPIFGLGFIGWFVWTGLVLLTKPVAE